MQGIGKCRAQGGQELLSTSFVFRAARFEQDLARHTWEREQDCVKTG